MAEIKMIKSMPNFPKGKEYIMNNKEAAQMWVDEGVAEYVKDPTPTATKEEKTEEEEKEKKKRKKHLFEMFLNDLKELIFKKYSVYFIQNDSQELYILYEDKTKKSFIYTKNKLYQHLIIEFKEQYDYFFNDIKVKQVIDFLIEIKVIKFIFDTGFKPIDKKLFYYEDNLYLNNFKPTNYLIKSNFKPFSEDYSSYLNQYSPNIFYLISNLCNFKEEQINYFIQWLGHKVQKPYEKIERGIVFYGEESSGKGLFFNSILKKIFSKYAYMSNMKHYDPRANQSNYNSHESQLIINAIDECYYYPPTEDIFKTKSTQQSKLINEKGGKQHEEQDFEDNLFFSNRELPIKAGDKRLSFIKSKKLKGNENKATEWVLTEFMPNLDKELNYFLNVLHYIEVDENIIRNNIQNEELREIKEKTKSLEDKFIDFIGDFQTLEDLESYLKKYSKTTIYNFLLNNITKPKNCNEYYISLQAIYKFYDLYLLSKDYEKKAVDKSQLFKVLNINSEDKEEYKQVRINGKREYCIKLSVFESFLDKGEDLEEEENSSNEENAGAETIKVD